jgi:hypothetical protein
MIVQFGSKITGVLLHIAALYNLIIYSIVVVVLKYRRFEVSQLLESCEITGPVIFTSMEDHYNEDTSFKCTSVILDYIGL